jgi:hypothetical protein
MKQKPDLPAIITTVPEITTSEQYVTAAKQLLSVKAAQAHIEGLESEMLGPVREIQAIAKAWFGSAKADAAAAETALKAAMEHYIEQRVPQAALDAQEQIRQGNTLGVLEAMVAVPPVEGISMANRVDFEVVDIDLVPPELVDKKVRHKDVCARLRRGDEVPGIIRKDRTTITAAKGGTK